MTKIIITFEIDELPDTDLPDGCTTVTEALHEMLCKAIHERSTDALDWLHDNIQDMTDTNDE